MERGSPLAVHEEAQCDSEGRDLSRTYRKHSRRPASVTYSGVSKMSDIAQGLAYLHEMNVTHSDLKSVRLRFFECELEPTSCANRLL